MKTNRTKERIDLAARVALVVLATGASVATCAKARSAHGALLAAGDGPEPDGFVDEADACHLSADLGSQDAADRPWGGALLVPPGLPADRRDALRAAASARRLASGAVWRLVDHAGPLPVGQDAMLVASCGGELFSFASVAKVPSGALAVDWARKPAAEWAPAIALVLALAEGATVAGAVAQ